MGHVMYLIVSIPDLGHLSYFVLCPCFVMQYFRIVSFLVLQISRSGIESWLCYFYCFVDVIWLLLFFASSVRCRGLVSNI